jgi:hypothetical protein
MRLWRRRLTISAPRMAIRSTVPWPLRWLLAAVVLGFSAAVALWAFEFGRDIAGLDRQSAQDLGRLRDEVGVLRRKLEAAEAVAHSAESLLTAEKTAQQQLTLRLKQLEEENRSLRGDLGFFERLIPAGGNDTVAIRGMQAERVTEAQLKWQLLLVQPAKRAQAFQGQLELSVGGLQKGKPWSRTEPASQRPVEMRQYLRLEGLLDVPADVVVKTVTVRLMEGSAVRSTQTIKLGTEK